MMLEEAHDLKGAERMYLEVLKSGADARAFINLGTIAYNRRLYDEAEVFYRSATVIDPEYTLAWFNLGNTLEELRRRNEAISAYLEALRLSPQYADAHYNLAIAMELEGLQSAALKHWQVYCSLDRSGPYAIHAQRRVQLIAGTSPLRLTSSKGSS